MDKMFDNCVKLLDRVANKTRLTYKQVNVLIFCFGWPVLTVWLGYKVIKNKKNSKRK